MKRKRRTFSAQFKAKVALEALQERETLQELARRHELHPNQIIAWKKQLLSGVPDVFSRKRSRETEAYEEELAKLYEEIGRLKMERDWLKKKGDQVG